MTDDQVYNALLVSANPLRLRELQIAAMESQRVRIAYSFDRYPATGEVVRMMQTVEADMVLLDMEEHALAVSMADTIKTCVPEAIVIAVVEHDWQPVDSTMPTGIVAKLVLPCSAEEFLLALQTADNVATRVCKQLFAFLPAKAGSGCSTVVLNTGAALAQKLTKKVLIVDADLRSGSLSLALNTEPVGSIQMVLHHDNLDSMDWSRVLVSRNGLDLLLSDRTAPEYVPGPKEYVALLQFFQPRFETILVDLPELVNPATTEIVRRAQSVFVVCTQEILSLKLAEYRFRELIRCGVSEDRIKVLLNRWQSAELPREDVSKLLKRPITALFPNDYRVVRTAILNGSTVQLNTSLGSSFVHFAHKLAGVDGPKETTGKWRPMTKMLESLVRS